MAVDMDVAHGLVLQDIGIEREGDRRRPNVMIAPQRLIRLLHAPFGQCILIRLLANA